MSLRRALTICLVAAIVVACVFFARENDRELTIRLTEIRYLVKDYTSDRSASNLMLGSSSIARFKSENYLDPSCGEWTNRGVGSTTIHDTLRYLKLSRTNANIENVILYLGENDLARTADVEPVIALYQSFLEELFLTFENASVNIIPVKPSPRRKSKWTTFQALNQRLKAWSELDDNLTFHEPEWMNVYQTGSDKESLPWFLDDGVHLTDAGYLAFSAPINKSCMHQ